MSKLAKVVEVSGCTSIDDMLRRSNTDWDIEVLSASTAERGINAGGFRALVRPDTQTALAYVGERFRANSHRAQLHTLDGMVSNGDIQPTSVSVWDNGAVLCYQFRCPGLDVTIHDKDVVSPLLSLAFAYGSQLADSAFFSDFRWFCKNQMGKVAKLNAESKVKHRGGIVERFGEILAGRIAELSGELGGRYESMRRMTSAPMAGKTLAEYFGASLGLEPVEVERAWTMPADDLRGPSGKIPEVFECYAVDDAGAPGTVWQAYNAVTRYETHKDGRSPETRQRRMLLGAGSDVANRAWELAAQAAA